MLEKLEFSTLIIFNISQIIQGSCSAFKWHELMSAKISVLIVSTIVWSPDICPLLRIIIKYTQKVWFPCILPLLRILWVVSPKVVLLWNYYISCTTLYQTFWRVIICVYVLLYLLCTYQKFQTIQTMDTAKLDLNSTQFIFFIPFIFLNLITSFLKLIQAP
jgi:hypothetical protein